MHEQKKEILKFKRMYKSELQDKIRENQKDKIK